ncbi:MAG: TauD/TfdA family dioxygenase, partial [Pseudomonadota bacterium]
MVITNEMMIDVTTPYIGATVSGVDLSEPLSPPTVSAIESALLEHQVLFFRDQDISLEAQARLGGYFGDLHIHPSAKPIDGVKGVIKIHADDTTHRVAGDSWHTDVSCDPLPPMLSILRLHTVPDSGGDTLFSSMYAAYDALSESMKQYLEGLEALHDGAPNYRDRNRRLGIDDSHKTYPQAVHPVIRTHPKS